MHRRSFIAMAATAPFAASFPVFGLANPHAERRFRPGRGVESFGLIQVEVQLARSEQAARGLRNREARDPFDGLVGEFYIADSYPIEVPDVLPGSVTTFETIVGVAGAKGVVHVGGFRRGLFVWTARVTGGPVDYVFDVGNAIVGYELPDEAAVRLTPGLLEGLLPGPEVFPVKVEIEAG